MYHFFCDELSQSISKFIANHFLFSISLQTRLSNNIFMIVGCKKILTIIIMTKNLNFCDFLVFNCRNIKIKNAIINIIKGNNAAPIV